MGTKFAHPLGGTRQRSGLASEEMYRGGGKGNKATVLRDQISRVIWGTMRREGHLEKNKRKRYYYKKRGVGPGSPTSNPKGIG